MHAKHLLTRVSQELIQQLKHFDSGSSNVGHHFHFVDIWPSDTPWSSELLFDVLKTIDRTLDRDDVVAVIFIRCPNLRASQQSSQSLDEVVRRLMSPKDADPPAVYLVPVSKHRAQIIEQIDGISTSFSSRFPGWSIGVQPVSSTHPDFPDLPVVIHPSSVACNDR